MFFHTFHSNIIKQNNSISTLLNFFPMIFLKCRFIRLFISHIFFFILYFILTKNIRFYNNYFILYYFFYQYYFITFMYYYIRYIWDMFGFKIQDNDLFYIIYDYYYLEIILYATILYKSNYFMYIQIFINHSISV